MFADVVGAGTTVYALSASKSLPEFLEQAVAEQGSMKRSREYKERLELIHGLQFSTGSAKVRASEDGHFIGVCGMYPPDIKVYETDELSLKFQRRLDSEIVDFLFLTPDYRKIALLQTDRSVEFHGQGGRHLRVRVPQASRHLAFQKATACLFVAGSSPSIYRIDLEKGAFLEPFVSEQFDSINSLRSFDFHPNLIFAAGPSGVVEIWDQRNQASSRVLRTAHGMDESLTCLDCHSNGTLLAIGSSEGICRLFDTRNTSVPLTEKDHNIDSPIVDICFTTAYGETCAGESCVLSADRHFVKAWHPADRNASTILAFETQGRINGICHYPKSGLIFVAQDHPKVGIHFAPRLGLAPPWALFLDSVVDDMKATKTNAFYDQYEFVTKMDLAALGIDPVSIKEKLKPQSHGYLINRKEYRKLRASMGVATHEELVSERVAKAANSTHEPMRIRVPKKPVAVNQSLASTLHQMQEGIGRRHVNATKQKAAKAVLEDDRFKALFDNPAFELQRA